MSTRPAMRMTGMGMVLVACLAGGCRPELPPSEDTIIEYLRNARVHGKVRRVWTQGQEYVNSVLEADAELAKQLSPLRELARADALWPHDDTRWQDKPETASAARDLVEHCEGHRATRLALLDKLGDAIAKTPDGLDLSAADAKAAFVDRVWTALAILEVDLRDGDVIRDLEAVAAAHLELVRAVQTCAAEFDADRPGLNFTDPACQRKIDQQYSALRSDLRDGREVFASYAEQKLAEIAPRLKSVDKKNARGEYEYLTYQSAYLTGELEEIPRELQSAIKKTEKELGQLESAAEEADQATGAKLQKKILVCQQSLEQYQADLAAWRPRVEAVVRKFKEDSRREE